MQLLPDLYAWADESRGYIYDWRIAGDELRLTTAMANIGEGDMEVRGGPIISGQLRYQPTAIDAAEEQTADVLVPSVHRV